MAKSLLGYKLHDARLDRNARSDSVTKTIKLPIFFSTPEEQKSIEETICHDNKNMWGTLNLDDFLKDGQLYTLVDFYIDALKLGIFFAAGSEKLREYINKLSGTETKGESLYGLIPSEKKSMFEKSVAIEMLTVPTREKSVKNYHKKIIKLYKGNIDENEARKISEKIFSEGIGKFASRKIFDLFEIDPPEPAETTSEYNSTFGKVTFAILPTRVDSFENMSDVLLFIEETVKKIEPRFESNKMLPFLGFGPNGNALSNFFGIFLKGLKVCSKEQLGKLAEISFPMCKNLQERQQIFSKLVVLKEKARKVKEPEYAKTWSDYRALFLGKMSSWVTNNANHEEKIAKLLDDQQDDFENVGKFLQEAKEKSCELEMAGRIDFSEAEGLFEDIKKLHGKFIERPTEDLEMYNEIVKELRFLLNKIFQFCKKNNLEISVFNSKKHEDEENEENDLATVDEKFKNLFKKVLNQGNFFGESNLALKKKFCQSPLIVKEGLLFLRENYGRLKNNISEKLFDDPQERLKILNQMLRLTRSLEQKNQEILRLFLQQFATTPIDLKNTKQTFSSNKFQRRSQEILESNERVVGSREILEIFEKNYPDMFDFLGEKTEKMIENAKISSFVFGFLTKHNFGKTKIDIGNLKNFAVAKSFVRLHGENLEPKQFARFVNSVVLSELKGALTLLSQKQITCRRSIQTTNGSEATLVCFKKDMPMTSASGEKVENAIKNKGHFSPEEVDGMKFGYLIQKPKDSIVNSSFPLNFANIIETTKEKEAVKAKNAFFAKIQTSRYQIQFLKWMLRNPKNKRTDASPLGAFLIHEQDYNIVWNWEENIPHLVPLNENSSRFYISQPIKFTNHPKAELRKNSGLFLGVDIGERALAWTIVDKTNFQVVKSGYIFDSQFASLRKEVQKNVEKQRIGTFANPNSRVANLRESLSHSLRNRIHEIAVKNNVEKIVYEDEISAFEQGGNKIRKIYHTLKIADVFSKIDSDKTAREQTWGKGGSFGMQVSASATSQTCSACKKWYRVECDLDQKNKYLLNVAFGTKKIQINGTEISCFVPSNYDCNKTEHTRWAIIGWVKKAMRPSIGKIEENKFAPSTALVELEKRLAENGIEICSEQFKKWFMERGNSALYVCPLCGHIADADLQASFNIALKGICKTKWIDGLSEKEKKDKPKYFNEMWLKEIGNLNYKPISFSLVRS